jgi:hypothetical protein
MADEIEGGHRVIKLWCIGLISTPLEGLEHILDGAEAVD